MGNEITTLDESKCLFHYGKKGMKWGKHKYTAIKNGQYIYGNQYHYDDNTQAHGSNLRKEIKNAN